MKKIQFLALSLAFLLFGISSCKKSDDTNNGTPTSTIITQGTWKITLFSNSGVDETANYTGYVFLFTTNGSVSATIGSFVTNGSWTTYNDDNTNRLQIDLGTTPPLDVLKNDWQILEKTNLKLRMSGSGGDMLTIERL